MTRQSVKKIDNVIYIDFPRINDNTIGKKGPPHPIRKKKEQESTSENPLKALRLARFPGKSQTAGY
jgi:hypothetical protein